MADWFRDDGVNRTYYYREDEHQEMVPLLATTDCAAFREAVQYVAGSGSIYEPSNSSDIPDFRIALLKRVGDNIVRARPELAD